jgi:hypothetical protein
MYGKIIPFTPKNYKKNENETNTKEKKEEKEPKEKKEENKNEFLEPKDIPRKQPISAAIFIPPMTPMTNAIFINQVQTNKNYYNKFQAKKRTGFTGRTGDWTCNNCRNLNFAFRVVCNRCKLPKPSTTEKKETNDDKKNNFENNNRNRFQNKNKYKYKKNYQYYNDSNSNSKKTQEEK